MAKDQGIRAPQHDVLFEDFRGQHISQDSDGRILAMILTHDSKEAEVLARHQSPYFDRVVDVQSWLTSKLWSEDGRSRIGEKMFPTNRQFFMDSQRARATTAREILKEFNAALPVLNGHRVVLQSRKPAPFDGHGTAAALVAFRGGAAARLSKFEQTMSRGLSDERNCEKFFPNWSSLPKPKLVAVRTSADEWTAKFGESRAAYQERMTSVHDPKRAKILVTQREQVLAGAAA